MRHGEGKYFWCYDHPVARRFRTQQELDEHVAAFHADIETDEAHDWTLERTLPCRKGCQAKFRTEKWRMDHEKRFHSTWSDDGR